MSRNAEILVLIVRENVATMYANADGQTRHIRTIECFLPPGGEPDEGAPGCSMLHIFACELMMALQRCANDDLYDGIVIFAGMPVITELREVEIDMVSRLLIAHIAVVPDQGAFCPGIVMVQPSHAEEFH